MLWVMSCVCVDVALSGVQYCYAVLPQEAALRVTSVHLSVWLFVPWPPLARKRTVIQHSHLMGVYSDTTQVDVELSCVAIDGCP